MRRFAIIFQVFLLTAITASAVNPERLHRLLDLGVEWGYTGTVQDRYHYNYTSEIGSRVDSRDDDYTFKSNGYLELLAGLKLGKSVILDATLGWTGVYEERNGMSAGFRASVIPIHLPYGGIKLFAEADHLFMESFADQKLWMAKGGAAFRVNLDRMLSMDLGLSAQRAFDHPVGVYDFKNNYVVPVDDMRRSDAAYLGVTAFISINF